MVTRQVTAKLVITVSPTFFLRTMPPYNSPRPGMVIINTSATDVSIHAVSPELGVHFSRILPPQAGGPASSASAMSPNSTQRSAIPKRATTKGTSLWHLYFQSPIVFLLVATD